jgi:sterol desaturase/sphingolipid hydroxylase (fatty acid hydroxylase superfamily)
MPDSILLRIAFALRHAYILGLVGVGFCVFVEIVWPKGKVSWASRLRAALFLIFSVSAFAICSGSFIAATNRLHLQPLLFRDFGAGSGLRTPYGELAAWIGIPFFAIVIDDFFFYWLHRAYHAWRPLWRFHRTHHAARELNALSSSAHVVEGILHVPFVALPVALLVHPDPGFASGIVMATAGLHGYFNHSSTKLNLGRLRYLLVDNRFHRIHHSLEQRHYDRNFGNSLSIWDQMFGTAHFPARDEWPATGLADRGEPDSIRDYVGLAAARPGLQNGGEAVTAKSLA